MYIIPGTSDNSVLQEAQVPIMSQSTCKTTDYVSDVNQYMLCAGYQQGGVDTCEVGYDVYFSSSSPGRNGRHFGDD